jgi:hypothetical protein
MSDVRIHARVVIQKVLGELTYEATLPNGKTILAYAKSFDAIPKLRPGDPYTVLMSLCDFGEGRLVPEDLKDIRAKHPVVSRLQDG